MPAHDRDRRAVVVAMIVVAVLVGAAAYSSWVADRETEEALTDERLTRVEQVAAGLDTMLDRFLAGMDVLDRVGFDLEPGSTRDTITLSLISLSVDDRGGTFIVDREGRVTSGFRMLPPAGAGTPVAREGLAAVLADGRARVLRVDQGLTVPGLAVSLAAPIHADGMVAGAVVRELEVAPDSALSDEISAWAAPSSGTLLFVDGDIVIASSDPNLVGGDLGPVDPGFTRLDGDVVTVAAVPTSGWDVVERQPASTFDGTLTTAQRLALLFIVAAGALTVVLVMLTVWRGRRMARDLRERGRVLTRARDELVRVVVEDVRTPVIGTVGFLRTALDHWDELSDEQRRRNVLRALENARLLQHLTADVVGLDLPAPAATEDVDVVELVGGRCRPHGASVTFTSEVDVAVVRAHLHRLERAIDALLDHALAHRPVTDPVEVTIHPAPGAVHVSVHDEGPRLLSTDLDVLFERFAPVRDAEQRGPGLDLHLARRIAEDHGGRVWAEPTSSGATLVIELPLETAQIVTPPSTTTTEPVM